MDILQTLILSVTMAVDCMCLGASDGILENKMKISKMIIIALVFGVMQGLMPTIGFFLGYLIKDYISSFIPWIAFTILMFLGLKSIIEAIIDIKKENKIKNDTGNDIVIENKTLKPGEIFLQGVATSIDALTIGFIYADKSIDSSLLTFLIIGVVTFALSFLTTFLGKKIGSKLQKIAPFIAGAVFICMAIKFVIEAYI
ncbi:MAG: manganese efflux pump [Bacilli bacterium]